MPSTYRAPIEDHHAAWRWETLRAHYFCAKGSHYAGDAVEAKMRAEQHFRAIQEGI